jgi:transposase
VRAYHSVYASMKSDTAAYKQRNMIERMFSRLKDFHRIAT